MSRRTLLFAMIVAVMAGLAYWDHRRSDNSELSAGEERVLTIARADITGLKYIKPDQTFAVQKDSDGFKMTEPVADDADSFAVVELIGHIVEGKIQKAAEDADVKDWLAYGLAPGVQIEVSDAKGTVDRFTVSTKNAFDGSFYLRKGDQLYLGDRNWAHVASRDAVQLRSRKPWRSKNEIVAVHFRNGTDRGQLSKSENGWAIEPAFDLPVDSQRVDKWLAKVREFQAQAIAADRLDGAKSQFHLDKPSAEIEFRLKDSMSPVRWSIGRKQDDVVHMQTTERPEVYRTTDVALREVLIPMRKLLDAAPVLRFAIEEVRELELVRNGKMIKITKSGNEERLAQFFEKIATLQPVVDDPPKDLRFSTQNVLRVRSADRQLLNLSWTEEKNSQRWLKVEKFKELFRVSAESLAALLNFDFAPPPPPEKDLKK